MDGNDGDFRLTIGQLARRTGLSVKTIRWYSDQGARPAGRPDGVPAFEWVIGALACFRLTLVGERTA